MAGNETREPTLAEIMEEIKRSRDEAAKDSERSRIAIWLTPFAVAVSMVLFALGRLAGVALSDWYFWWPDAASLAIGFLLIFWVWRRVRRVERRFREKWKEEPRF